jgi:hypothetical protein
MLPTATVTTTDAGITLAIRGEVTGQADSLRSAVEAAMSDVECGSSVTVDLAECPGLGIDGVGLLRGVYAMLPRFSELEIRATPRVAPLLRNLFCRAERRPSGEFILASDGSVVRPMEPEMITTVC